MNLPVTGEKIRNKDIIFNTCGNNTANKLLLRKTHPGPSGFRHYLSKRGEFMVQGGFRGRFSGTVRQNVRIFINLNTDSNFKSLGGRASERHGLHFHFNVLTLPYSDILTHRHQFPPLSKGEGPFETLTYPQLQLFENFVWVIADKRL